MLIDSIHAKSVSKECGCHHGFSISRSLSKLKFLSKVLVLVGLVPVVILLFERSVLIVVDRSSPR